jgi:hypothetical protein
MGRGIKIEFAFVPMPLEAFDADNPLREAGLRLLAYILKHTRFGEAFPEVTYEELLNGILDDRGRRRDNGCGLSRNGIKNGQTELEERGWLEAKNLSTDKSRPRWKYRLVLGEREVSPSDSALSRNDSSSKVQVVSRPDSASSPSDHATVTSCEVPSPNDTCNKEEESTKNLDKELEKAGDGKRHRLSQTERDSWDLRRWREEFDKLQRSSVGSGNGSDREWLESAKTAAMRAGVTLRRLHELLKPFYPNDLNIDRLIEQNPLFPDEQRAEPAEESAEQVQRRMESGKRAGVVFEYVRDYVKARISPHSFDTWIKPLRAVSLDGGVLTLRVPTAEFKQIGEKFGDVLEKAIAGRADDVKFVTDAVEQRATA